MKNYKLYYLVNKKNNLEEIIIKNVDSVYEAVVKLLTYGDIEVTIIAWKEDDEN